FLYCVERFSKAFTYKFHLLPPVYWEFTYWSRLSCAYTLASTFFSAECRASSFCQVSSTLTSDVCRELTGKLIFVKRAVSVYNPGSMKLNSSSACTDAKFEVLE